MELIKIRSLFGFMIVFVASLTVLFIIVITFQPHQLVANSSISATTPGNEHVADASLIPIRQFITGHAVFLRKTHPLNAVTGDTKHAAFSDLHHTSTPGRSDTKDAFETQLKSISAFQKVVRERADKDGVIFLASVDCAYVTMALNLYLTSFQALNITNYLFVGTDDLACQLLAAEHPVTCVQHFTDREGNHSSNWGSSSFSRKTHYKTKIILDALLAAVTPVIVDLDIVFFKNPLQYLTCLKCDLQIQSDVSEGNSGFYMTRPTRASIELHEKALAIGSHNTKLSNQKALGRVIDLMTRQRRIRVRTLHRKLFPCGTRYFEERRIMFAGDAFCGECVLVHNNWIVSQEAKIYRFRETGLWQVDTDGYYSDPDRKYITYDNPVDFGPKRTLRIETNTLKSALAIGVLLNRTVILPTFHCHGCKYAVCNNTRRVCALNTFYRIVEFDRNFAGLYREHVFLDHPKIPDSVKHSLSYVVLVKADKTPKLYSKTAGVTKVFSPDNATLGPTVTELISWFGTGDLADFAVLRFHSMYGAFRDFKAIEDLSVSFGGWTPDGVFTPRRMAFAFNATDYRQY